MYKQRLIILAFMLMLTLVQPTFLLSSLAEQNSVGDLLTNQTSDSVGSGASEEENIDSFLVHPANRWTEVNTGYTAVVENSVLNLTDTGDTSADNYKIDRGLSKLDSKIEVRFYFRSNGSSASLTNNMAVYVYGDGTIGTDDFSLIAQNIKDDAYATTKIRYRDVAGTSREKTLSGDEQLHSGYWYLLKIDYDLMKSKIRYKVSFDNGSRVFDYYWYDISSDYIPGIFKSTTVNVRLYASCLTDGQFQEVLYSYIKAPFKEREWEQYDVPTDDFIHDSWDGCRETDDSDESIWQLIVPYLDSFSGSITANTTDNSLQDDLDVIQIGVELFGVDADDGDLHLIGGCSTGFLSTIPANVESIYGEIYDGDFSEAYEEKRSIAVEGPEVNPRLTFSVSLKQDRSIGSFKVRYFPDIEVTNEYLDWMIDFTVSDYVTDPSQEFVIRVFHNFNSIPNTYDAYTMVEDFGLFERNLFADIIKPVVEGIGGFLGGIITGIFIIIGRFLASIFRIVGDIIVAALGVGFAALGIAIAAVTSAINQIQGWLTALGTTIGTAINQIEGWLTTIATTISEAIAAIAADIWTAFGTAAATIMNDIIVALTALAEDFAEFLDAMIAFLIPLLAALAEELAGLLEDIIAFLLPLLGALAEAIVELIADIVFWFWDALSLPDVLAVLDVLLVGFTQFITGLPQLIADLTNYGKALVDLVVVLGFIYIFILPIAIAATAGACIEKIIDHALKDITGGSAIMGFSFPIPLIGPWFILLMFTMLDGTVFFGFF